MPHPNVSNMKMEKNYNIFFDMFRKSIDIPSIKWVLLANSLDLRVGNYGRGNPYILIVILSAFCIIQTQSSKSQVNSCSFMQLNQPPHNIPLPYFVIHQSPLSLPYLLYFPQINQIQCAMTHLHQLQNQMPTNIPQIYQQQKTSKIPISLSKTPNINFSSEISEKQKKYILEKKTVRAEYQKDGRNANSNLLRIFFRKLDQELQSQPQIINKIIKKYKIKITYPQFVQWFEINKMDPKNYIRLPSAKRLFYSTQKNEYAKIMRILLNHFLKSESLCAYLTSKKIKKTMMDPNYTAIRNIFKDLHQTSNE